MPLRGTKPLTFKARGVTDAIDATNAFPGAMTSLADLIPNPTTKNQFVPRPASTQTTNFSGFTTPAQGELLAVIGTRAYGMIASSRFTGKSEPFCYDLAGAAFVSITGPTSANCPASQAATGDWTPPRIAMINNRLIICHPGYDGVTNFIGWIDMRGFSLTTTGDTHTNTTIDNLASTAGIMVGDSVSGAGIPASTYVTAIPSSTSVTISNAATATAAGVSLTFAGGTTAAPLYGAGQTSGHALAGVPVDVINFNGRAYYAVANGVQFSDALVPTSITNANQALTLGDSVAVNALGGLPINQVTGGVLQAIIAFKGDEGYFQITGDPATSNLASNFVEGSVGTLAPNTLCGTPLGLAYVAPDGLRIVDLSGKSNKPIGSYGDGVSLAFLFAVHPSRMCAAYAQNVIRLSVQNGAKNGQPWEEYWFDLVQEIWTGPHSFPAGLIQPYNSTSSDFLLFAEGINAKLWESKVQPSAAATYTENSVAMTFTWQTSLQPDNQEGSANQIVQSTLGLSMPASQALTISAFDEQGNTLDTVSLSGAGGGSGIWNSFNWGAGTWGGTVAAFEQYTIPWHNALVFKQMSVQIVGQSTSGLVIGNLYAKYQPTGYFGGH